MIRRIVTQPTKILDKTRGAYWRGERCEDIVAQRIAQRAAEKASRRSSRRGNDVSVKTPEQQLRRLERALKKRKTETGRISVKNRIKELKREMAGA